jgi:hypothetical protein
MLSSKKVFLPSMTPRTTLWAWKAMGPRLLDTKDTSGLKTLSAPRFKRRRNNLQREEVLVHLMWIRVQIQHFQKNLRDASLQNSVVEPDPVPLDP